jgi:galactoside O-acetyltransferase
MIIKSLIKLKDLLLYGKIDKERLIVSDDTYFNFKGLQFSTNKENRNYVEIGSKGIITAKFIFETANGTVKIGDNVHMGMTTFICRNGIEIEDDVTMAWDITLYDHNSHSIYWDERKNDNHQCYEDYTNHKNNIVNKDWSNVRSAQIKICSKAWIGFGVTILKGVTIGEGAVVGAKSLVTKDVPPWTIVGGNPAKIIKEIPLERRS